VILSMVKRAHSNKSHPIPVIFRGYESNLTNKSAELNEFVNFQIFLTNSTKFGNYDCDGIWEQENTR